MYKQDLHIHTIFSKHDGAVVPEQNPELISKLKHAEIIGISDHFEDLMDNFDEYEKTIKSYGFKVGTEVDGSRSAKAASLLNFDYYIYHCRNKESEYKALDILLSTGKPVIIAHPNYLETNLNKVPKSCIIEISNRYVYKYNWRVELMPFITKFEFVISSDAHQPNWLNQHVARYVANELGIKEKILF